MKPETVTTTTPTDGETMYVHVECPDCKRKDEALREIEKRAAGYRGPAIDPGIIAKIARAALKEAGE